MKSNRKRAGLATDSGAKGRHAKKKAEDRQPVPEKTLNTLYSRLEQTQPGSEESKRIADEIIDAIG
jgi:hypothetical protein